AHYPAAGVKSPELEAQRAPPSGPVAERCDAASRDPRLPLAPSGKDVGEGGGNLLRPERRRQAWHGRIGGEEVDGHPGWCDPASRLPRSLSRRAKRQRPEHQALPQLVEDLACFAGHVLDVENVAGGTPVRGSEPGPVQGGRQGPGHCSRAKRHLQPPALPIGDAHGSGHIEDTHRSRSPATPNSAASSRALSRTSNRSCTVPRPADPNLLRRPASSRRVAMLAAIPSTSWGRLTSPF